MDINKPLRNLNKNILMNYLHYINSMNTININELFLNNRLCKICQIVKDINQFQCKTKCNDCKKPKVMTEEMIIKKKEINKKYYEWKKIASPETYYTKKSKN